MCLNYCIVERLFFGFIYDIALLIEHRDQSAVFSPQPQAAIGHTNDSNSNSMARLKSVHPRLWNRDDICVLRSMQIPTTVDHGPKLQYLIKHHPNQYDKIVISYGDLYDYGSIYEGALTRFIHHL